MARYSETFSLTNSFKRSSDICRQVFNDGEWRFLNDDGWAFMVLQRVSVIERLFVYPVKFAVMLREDTKRSTLVELHGHSFGFGPIPKNRIRRKMKEIRARIDQLT